jgi:hypothetical protein
LTIFSRQVFWSQQGLRSVVVSLGMDIAPSQGLRSCFYMGASSDRGGRGALDSGPHSSSSGSILALACRSCSRNQCKHLLPKMRATRRPDSTVSKARGMRGPYGKSPGRPFEMQVPSAIGSLRHLQLSCRTNNADLQGGLSCLGSLVHRVGSIEVLRWGAADRRPRRYGRGVA